MTADDRPRLALPRLLVSLAVLLCLLGLGESMPGEHAASHGAIPVPAPTHAMHDTTDTTASTSAAPAAESAESDTHRDAGHSSHGLHAASCMVAVAAAAVPLLVSATSVDIGFGSWVPAKSGGRAERAPSLAGGADPPDLCALCVQRV